jgi:hypothetical protein
MCFEKYVLHYMVHAIPSCVLCSSLSTLAEYLVIGLYVNRAFLCIIMAGDSNLAKVSNTDFFVEICTICTTPSFDYIHS